MSKSLKLLTITISIILFSLAGNAASGITYHGRILRSNGDPVNGQFVGFRLRIMDGDTGSCQMYEEIQTKDMRNSAGVFSLVIGDGSVAGTYGATGVTFFDGLFENAKTYNFAVGNSCNGTPYTALARHGRKLNVSFRESPADPWEDMPVMNIEHVPFAYSALNAQKVGNHGDGSLLRVENAGTPQTIPALTPTQYSELFDLVSGSSTQYVQSVLGTASQITVNTVAGVATVGLADVATAGTYGSATQVPVFTLDAKGRITSVTNTTITGAAPTGAAGGDLTGNYPNPDIAAGVVGATELATDAVTTAKILNANVTTAKIADGNVTDVKLAADSVTSAKILDGTITGNDISSTAALSVASVTATGAVSSDSVSTRSIGLFELPANGTNYVAMKAPDLLAGNTTYTWPAAAPGSNMILQSDNAGNLSWVADATGTAPGDASYAAKGVVQFDTDAATSGISVASGIAKLATSGVAANTYGAAATVPVITVDAFGRVTSVTDTAIALNASAITAGILPIARGGTNSGTALNNNRIMVSSGGAIVEAAALTNGQLLIGSTGAAPVAATLTAGTGVTINNTAGGIEISAAGSGGTITALTGDVTASGTGSVTATIPNDTVTFAKFQNITDQRILGRSAGSAGDMQELTIGTGLDLTAGVLTATATAPGDASYAAKGIVRFDTDAATSGITVASGVAKLANSGVTANTYGAADKVPVIAVDAFGRITSAVDTNIALAASAITSGILDVARGGTGTGTLTANRMFIANGTGTALVADSCTVGQVLQYNGTTWTCLASTSLGPANPFVQNGNAFGAKAVLGTTDNNDLEFITNNTAKITVLAGGNVGIGVAAPSEKLEVRGNISMTGSTSGAVKFAVPAVAGSATYTWPAAAPGSNMVLQSDSSGNLSWVAAAASSITALTGDVAASGSGSVTATIANDAVTFAKFQNITDNRILGRSAGSAGDMQEITVGTGLDLTAGVLTATATAPGDASYAAKGVVQFDTDAATSGITVASGIAKLATSGVAANTYGAADKVPVIAVDAFGRITSAVDTNIAIAASQVTSGILDVARGGTGTGTLTANRMFMANGLGTALVADTCTVGQVLRYDGTNWVCVASTSMGPANAYVQSGNAFGAKAVLGTTDNNDLEFITNNTAKMLIQAGGNVGIGTSSPSAGGTSASAAKTYLTLKGSTAAGVLQMTSAAADADGVQLGSIEWVDSNSSDANKRAGYITILTQGTTANNRGSYMAFATRSDGASSALERMKITNAGDGIIGVAGGVPQARFDIVGSTNDNTANAFNVRNPGGTTILRARNDGNVGINTTTPGAKLDVKGDFAMSGSTSGSVKFAVPAAAGSATYTWPAAAPASNMVLQSDSSGNLSWVADATGGTPADASYAAKGIVQFDTDAATSGITVASGIAKLANSGVTAATYGTTAAKKVSITIDAFGRITSASEADIAIAASQVTSGILDVARGGTGTGTLTANRMFMANGLGTALVADTCTVGQVLRYDGTNWVCVASTSMGPANAYVQSGNAFGAKAVLGTTDNNDLEFITNNTAKMTVLANGNVGIGTTAPTAKLHLPAGTASANTAPFKLTAGTNLTTPEPGAIEYDGTNLYYTDGTSTRRTLSYSGSGAASSGASTSQFIINSDTDNAGSDGGVYFQRNGSTVASISNAGRMLANVGDLPNPGLSFHTDPNTGVGNLAADTVSIIGGGIEAMRFNTVASGVNYLAATPAAAGSSPILSAAGADTNIDLSFTPKGSGKSVFTGNIYAATSGTTGPEFILRSNDTGGHEYKILSTATGNGGGAGMLRIYDQTAAADRFAIGATGNVGIGTTSPSVPLEVNRSAPGTISSSGTTVTGTGTTFLSTFKVGDSIYTQGQVRTIDSISSDTSLTTSVAFSPAFTNIGYTRTLMKMKGALELEADTISTASGSSVGSDLLVLKNTASSEGWNTGAAIKFEGASGKKAARIHTSYDGGTTNYNLTLNSSGTTEALVISFGGGVAVGGFGGSNNTSFMVRNPRSSVSGIANGTQIAQTLTATANNDALNALYINPTFAPGAYTGVSQNGLIVASGNVGIGTTAPSEKLEVSGNVKATSFISTSDRRLKTDIRDIEGLELIRKLNGVRYKWKSDGKDDFGLIAQEVEEVIPDAVVTDKNGYKAVKYSNLVSPLIQATKELDVMCRAANRDIASLKQENSELKSEIQDLKLRLEKIEKLLSQPQK